MNYYRVHKESKMYQDLVEWRECRIYEVQPKGEAYIANMGIDPEYIGFHNGLIYVQEGHLPEDCKSKFTKADNGWHGMKRNSSIYKKWITILKSIEPKYNPNWFNSKIHDFNPVFYVSGLRGYFYSLSLGIFVLKCDGNIGDNQGLIEIPEIEYLELKLKCLKNERLRNENEER